MTPGQLSTLINYVPDFSRAVLGNYTGSYEIKTTYNDNEVIIHLPKEYRGTMPPYRITWGTQVIEIYISNLDKQPLKIRKIEKCSPQTR